MLTENQFKGIFETIKPNKEHKDKLLHDMIVKIESETVEKRMPTSWRHVRSAMLAAAVMICLLTTTAFAASYMGLDMKFLNFLNPANSEQVVYLENGAHVVNKQAVNENGTLEVKQIIGDSNLIYILMDFTAPEGTVLDAKRYRFETLLSFDNMSSNSSSTGYTLLDDENPNDNKISLMMNYLTENRTIAGSPVTLMLSGLEAADVYPDIFEKINAGSWKIKFNLDYKDISTTYQIDQGISLYNYEATLSSISISPISVTIKVDSAHTKEISEAASRSSREIGLNEYADHYPITIHYKDGTSETTAVFKGMSSGDLITNTITIVKPFTPIINDKEIKSVEFFDTVIPMD
ncbi:DUF4179 domain-containing protein [Bacillus sp. FJAT-28004]|uniref:DUF4179 domain-containing protein n=1 Tax=Bacillus sp. FJAT-28004 TaxID=1679165 RepID=UPI0006B5C8FC|nr:DUF4179 domain-containing protein [Bacillus sp. FJAT-28004]